MAKNQRLWSSQEIAYLVGNFSDKLCSDIAEKLGRSRKSVERKADAMGLVRNDRQRTVLLMEAASRSPANKAGKLNGNWRGGLTTNKEHIREKNREFARKRPEVIEAHRKYSRALRTGKLVKQPCEVCGNPTADGHHDDYSKPLEVRWLCDLHHNREHAKKRIRKTR